MKLKVEKSGDHAVIGGQLSQEQIEALSSISVQPDHILNHMDDLNEELKTVSTETQKTKVNNMPKRRKPMSNANTSTFQKTRKKKTVEDDFDQALNDIEAQVDSKSNQLQETNQVEQNQDTNDGSMKSQILELLKETPGAPSEAQINKWKAVHGENAVHVMAFGKGDVYIYTHLKRGQWKKIQEVMAKIQETQNTDAEDALKEKVLQYCVLWPSSLPLEFFYNSRAGVVDSLYQVILLNSYFLSPQQAMLLTTQL